MGTLVLKQVGRHNTALFSDGTKEVARLSYTGFWRSKAEILTPLGPYTIKQKGMGDQLVLFNDHPVIKVHYTWREHVELNDIAHPERSLILKRPSIWRQQLQAMDRQGHVCATFTMDFSWKTWRTEHTLTMHPGIDPPEPLMLMVALHAIITQKRSHAAV